jgi:hypothetical protein
MLLLLLLLRPKYFGSPRASHPCLANATSTLRHQKIKRNNNSRLQTLQQNGVESELLNSGNYEHVYLLSFPHAVFSACCLFHADFFLGLLFAREDGSDISLRNVR